MFFMVQNLPVFTRKVFVTISHVKYRINIEHKEVVFNVSLKSYHTPYECDYIIHSNNDVHTSNDQTLVVHVI